MGLSIVTLLIVGCSVVVAGGWRGGEWWLTIDWPGTSCKNQPGLKFRNPSIFAPQTLEFKGVLG